MKVGIIGLPNVGKSTIFNALTNSDIPANNYPFCTIEPNVGMVIVPDARLDKINSYINSEKIIPTTIEFVDIAGLVEGASKGEGLGNQFLSHIRNVDAIIHLVRCYEDSNITHVANTLDPLRDIEIIETELLLKDLDSIEKRIPKATKTAKSGDKDALLEVDLLNKIKDQMNNGVLMNKIDLNESEKEALAHLSFITNKPIIYAANISEEDISSNNNSFALKVLEYAESNNCQFMQLCGKIEMEISKLANDDKIEFLNMYNLKDSALNHLIQLSYDLLGLQTFFTAGEKEIRAWTIKKGFTAPEAAGVIHTDFQKGFIKAETYNLDDLIEHKSELSVKNAGKIRLEGKNYIVQEGDIIFFKFNV